ncbi:RNA polymerase subunit RPO18, partial [Monkeypox virus]
MSSFVTNG